MNWRSIPLGLRVIFWLTLGLVVVALAYPRWIREPIPERPMEEQAALAAALDEHGRAPHDYVLEKLRTHDIVFLGEYHRLRQDLEFVRSLIPLLFEAGIPNLAIEFGSSDLQRRADSLLVADDFDEAAIRRLVFDHKVYWGFHEYLDLYRAAWEVNRSRQDSVEAFRIVHLDYTPKFELRRADMTEAEKAQVFDQGDPDVHMARTLVREVVAPGEKALVLCGRNHAFTRFHQPFFDASAESITARNKYRLGNLVRRSLGDRTCTILLHAPWYRAGSTKAIYPVEGAIDRLMHTRGGEAVGFDTRGTAFGALVDLVSDYSKGDSEFTLGGLCDGYIFLRPMSEFEGCRWDPLFITEENFDEAMRRFPTPLGRRILRNEWLFEKAMQWEANPKRHFRHLTG